jgi:hypothetical protein
VAAHTRRPLLSGLHLYVRLNVQLPISLTDAVFQSVPLCVTKGKQFRCAGACRAEVFRACSCLCILACAPMCASMSAFDVRTCMHACMYALWCACGCVSGRVHTWVRCVCKYGQVSGQGCQWRRPVRKPARATVWCVLTLACTVECSLVCMCDHTDPSLHPWPAPWPQFGRNSEHTGQSSLLGPTSSLVNTPWTYATGGQIVGSPAVGPSTVVRPVRAPARSVCSGCPLAPTGRSTPLPLQPYA